MKKTAFISLLVLVIVLINGSFWQNQKYSLDNSSKIETNNLEEPSALEDWQTYQNVEHGFQIIYPEEWVYEESGDQVYFGTPESKQGGYIWMVSIHQPDELEKIISQMGTQFEDRKEVRSEVMLNTDIFATKVIVTTNTFTDWVYENIFFERDEQLFVIGNGSIDDDRFEIFYQSFQFSN